MATTPLTPRTVTLPYRERSHEPISPGDAGHRAIALFPRAGRIPAVVIGARRR
jgi:hypothetical protein